VLLPTKGTAVKPQMRSRIFAIAIGQKILRIKNNLGEKLRAWRSSRIKKRKLRKYHALPENGGKSKCAKSSSLHNSVSGAIIFARGQRNLKKEETLRMRR